MGSCLSLGLDVSKGRIDGLFLHEAGTPLPGAGSFDDTDSGHRRLVQEIRGKLLQFPEVDFRTFFRDLLLENRIFDHFFCLYEAYLKGVKIEIIEKTNYFSKK